MRRSFLLAAFLCASAWAEPFLPASDALVLERLPYKAGDPVLSGLREQRARLREQPDNLRLALQVARAYTELGRINGDPRYAGYAQAALMTWWNRQHPPNEVLLLRATLRQRVHDFNGALGDLNSLIQADPWNAQAWLTRATVLQVQGHYQDASSDCEHLRHLAGELVTTVCLTSIGSVTGYLRDSYAQLRLALDRYPQAAPSLRSWVLTALAEMAVRAGLPAAAENHFRQALALDPGDFYLLGAYADFLLDQHRPAEVARLLADKTSADPLLLRYSLALQAQHSVLLPMARRQLVERFAASHMRGDRVHLREEARFTLHVLNDPASALQLARDNWNVQKEPADVRILLEAALASRDEPTLASVTEWLGSSRLEDVSIRKLLAVHPDPAALRTQQR